MTKNEGEKNKFYPADDVLVKARFGKPIKGFILDEPAPDGFYQVGSWLHGTATEHYSNLELRQTIRNFVRRGIRKVIS